MNTKLLLFVALLLFQTQLVFSQCNSIEKIQNYKSNIKIVYSNLMYNDYIDTSTFNIDTYMKLYPALKKREKRIVFDYHYSDHFFDGEPHLYVRAKKFNLIKHINKKADKIKLKGDERRDFIDLSLRYFFKDTCNMASQNIFPEDTEEGYIQYLYFCEFGELFALKWHASYKSKQVICTKAKITEIVRKYTEEYKLADSETEIDENGETTGPVFYCDTVALQKLLFLEPVFSSQFNTDCVIIKWLEIEEWQGIFERTYKVMRQSPYRIEKIGENQLVEFQHNIIL